VGIGYGSLTFDFADAQLSASHSTGGFPELTTTFSVFPLRLVDRSVISGLGLRLTYSRGLGQSTTITDAQGTAQTLDTNASRGWGGLVFALPRPGRYWPRLELRTGFSFTAFLLDANEVAPPHLELYVGWGAALVQPITRWLQVHVSGEYRAIVAAATPLMDMYRIDFRSVQSGLLRTGLEGRLVGGLGYRASFEYEPFGGDLRAREGDDTLHATGRRVGASFALRYGF